MSILSTVKKGYITIKTTAGYVKLLPRTLATLVAMSDGKSVEEKITELNGKLGYATERSVTLNGWTIYYRNAGAGYIYVDIARRVSSLDSGSQYTEITNLPFTVAFKQRLTIVNHVGYTVVGSGMAFFDGSTLACCYERYSSEVTNRIFGLLRVV